MLAVYLIGTVQSSWILVDFYWNRDDYTLKYCQFLDQGITQCRASCYLGELLDEMQDEEPPTKITLTEKVTLAQLACKENITLTPNDYFQQHVERHNSDNYRCDFRRFIFHPPKA